jgi:phospholipid/cholesterol/gamma-HCH transport system permease protein
MTSTSAGSAVLTQSTPNLISLSGAWSARDMAGIAPQARQLQVPRNAALVADCGGITSLDTAGAWVLQRLLQRLQDEGATVTLSKLSPPFEKILATVTLQAAEQARRPSVPAARRPGPLESVGLRVSAAGEQFVALLRFVGESAMTLLRVMGHPRLIRWRPIAFNIRSGGLDAMPIVALMSFMLGVVVAYQGADQLRHYGANIFVADLVGLSVLREFGPLITAIIIAGRSGSAYAAQIGTMAVTEEIDAMRTLGIAPIELLVLPKVIALVIALPLLTVCADLCGVIGGMVMAKVQLDVGYSEFLDRFLKAVSVTSYVVGVGKAPVFAAIISTVGCFQGFRTRGGADSVGRQTTVAVVQTIFLVIVADGLFSVAFSALDL